MLQQAVPQQMMLPTAQLPPAIPQATQSFIPYPQVPQVPIAAPVQMAAPAFAPQVQPAQPVQYAAAPVAVGAATTVVEQVQYAAPQPVQYAPQFETLAAQPVQYAAPQVMAAPQVTYAAPQATVFESVAAPAYSTVMQPAYEQVRMPSIPATTVPQVQYAAQQAVQSYIPQQMPQMTSYMPAPVMETVAAPVTYAQPQMYAQPQVASYIPQPQVIETVAPTMSTYGAYAPQQQVFETFAPQPVTASYMPAPAVTYASAQPVVETFAQAAMPGGQSVIVEQMGDWLVCEDAQGIFYHHTPSQQSYDNAPPEFLVMFPGGYSPPYLGAFAQAPFAAAPVMETFAAPTYAPQMAVSSYIPAPQPMVVSAPQVSYAGATQVMAAPQAYGMPVVEQFQSVYPGNQQMVTQGFQGVPQALPPVMARVLG
jgi:hypothetical protein